MGAYDLPCITCRGAVMNIGGHKRNLAAGIRKAERSRASDDIEALGTLKDRLRREEREYVEHKERDHA